MAYIYNTVIGNPKYSPKMKWLDKPKRTPEEYKAFKATLTDEYKQGSFPKRIHPGQIGTRVKLIGSRANVPDCFCSIFKHGCSERFRELVEELEPNVHEFIPFKILRKDGSELDGDYYGFSNLQVLDSMVPEQSSVAWVKVKDREYFHWQLTEPPTREYYSLRKKIIAGKHIWWEKITGIKLQFCSEELHAKFKERGLKHLEFKEVKEI